MALSVSIIEEKFASNIPPEIREIVQMELAGRYGEDASHLLKRSVELTKVLRSVDLDIIDFLKKLHGASLYCPGCRFSVTKGGNITLMREVYNDSINGEASALARACGIYDKIWGQDHGDWAEWSRAHELIEPLKECISKLKNSGGAFSKYALFDEFCEFISKLLVNCEQSQPKSVVICSNSSGDRAAAF